MSRFRLRYIVYLAGLIALIVVGSQTSTTPATPPPSEEVRESTPRIPVTGGPEGASARMAEVRRHGRPRLLWEMDLTSEQVRRLRALTDEKEQEARKLQDKVVEIHMSVPQVSKRIDEIQSAFEAKVAEVLSPDQMEMFYALKEQGKIDTPAIMVPDSAAGQ